MNFIITGDSLFSSQNLAQTIDEALVAKLQTADAVFTNAEFVTPNLATPPAAGRGYVTSVRPALLDEFTKLNIRYVGFANNHTGDFGIQGMLDTLEESRKRNIIPLGLLRIYTTPENQYLLMMRIAESLLSPLMSHEAKFLLQLIVPMDCRHVQE